MLTTVERGLDVTAEVDDECLVSGAFKEGDVFDPLCVLLVVLVVSPADTTIFVLAAWLGHKLSQKSLTISSISMSASATRLRWSASSCY